MPLEAGNRIGSVYIHLGVTSDMNKFTRAADDAARISNRMRGTIVAGNRQIADSFTRAAQAVSVLHGPLGGVASRLSVIGSLSRGASLGMASLAAGSAAATFGMAKFVQVGDKMQRMANNLRTVTNGSADLADTQQKLFDISQRARVSMEGNVTLYARTARATEHLGISQQKLLRIVETVQKSFAVGGATPAEAMGAAIQLSQGIASDRFSGEEFRSVSENAPVLLREMAKQLGVTIGKLREMAHAGELTGKVVTEAIYRASTAIDKDFSKTVSTFEQGMARLGNSVDQYVYNVDKSYGITQTLAAGVNSLADSFDDLMWYVESAAIGLAAFAGGRIGGAALKVGKGYLGEVAAPGLFARTRMQTKKELEEVTGSLRDINEARKKIEQQIRDQETRFVERASRSNNAVAMVKAAHDQEIAGNQKLASLEREREVLRGRQVAQQKVIVEGLRQEQAEARKAVQAQQVATTNAGRRFKRSGALSDFDSEVREVEKLQRARENLARSSTRLAAAERGVFDPAALRAYGAELDSIQKQLNANLVNQHKVQQDISKAQHAYILAQRQSPEEARKFKSVADQHRITMAALVSDQRKMAVQYDGLIQKQSELNGRLSLANAAWARIGGFARGLWGLIGGGPGFALTAAIASMTVMATAASRAAERSRSLREEMVSLGLLSKEVADAFDGVGKSIEEMAADEALVKFQAIRHEMERMQKGQAWWEQIFSFDDKNLGNIRKVMELAQDPFGGSDIQSQFAQQMIDVIDSVNKAITEGTGDIDGMIAKLDQLGKMDINTSLLKYVGNLRLAIKQMQALEVFSQKVAEQSLRAGNTSILDEMRVKVDDLRESLINTAQQKIQFISDEDMAAAQEALDLFVSGSINLEEFQSRIEELRTGSGGVFDRLYESLVPLVNELRKANSELEEMSRYSKESTRWGDAHAKHLREEIDARKNLKEFFDERNRISGLTSEQKAIEDRTKAILKAAEKEKGALKEIDEAEARRQAQREINNETAVKIFEGLKDLEIDALAGQMDEWNQSIVKTAKSLGVTKPQIEAFIAAVTSGDLSKVPEVFKKIAEAMQKASENALAKSLHDVQVAFRSLGLPEFDRQLIDLAISAGMSNEELDKIIEALRTGDATGLSETVRKTREELQKLAETDLLRELQFSREQAFRTKDEQDVASKLREIYGDNYKSQMNGAVAGQIRLTQATEKYGEELEKVRDIAKDAFTSIVDSLFEAGDLGEKLIGIFADVGKQFARIGAEKLFDSITGRGPSIFGGSSGGSGGGSSLAYAGQVGSQMGREIAPVISDNLNGSLQTYAAAIRKIESGSYAGNYGAMGQVITNPKSMYYGDRAYGAYQVMGKNIGSWTKEVLGQSMTISQFLGDKIAQDKVAYAKLQQSFDKFGNWADVISVHFTGQPVASNRNRSDGFTTANSYVSQVQSAAEAYGGLKSGVSEGVQTGLRKAANDNWAGMREVTPGANGPSKMDGVLGALGAGFGAFAGGLQSGDPFSGALGGAMSGLGAASTLGSAFPALGAMAAPLGIIGGAVLGLIGGLIGRSKRKKQELKQAQQELESQLGAISDLMATATGNFFGGFQKQFTSTIDELNKAIQMAEKAKNTTLANNLRGAMNTFFEDLTDKWNRGFEGMIASLNAGDGLDGAFMKGMGAVENMRESLIGFVNDAKFFAEANGDLQKAIAIRDGMLGVNNQKKLNQYQASVWINKDQGYLENELVEGYLALSKKVMERGVEAFSKQGGQLYATLEELREAAELAGVKFDELGNILEDTASAQDVEDAVRRSQDAARATLYAQLSGSKALTELEEAIQNVQGKAAAMPPILEDLGISAETAAKAIEHHLNRAMENLRVGLVTDLTRSINQLAGADYLNELIDAQTTYETRLRDLAAVGMDTSLAAQELTLRLRNIAKEAELTDDQLTALAKAFPQMDIALLGLRGMLDTSLSVDEAKAKLDEAKADLRSAYEKEASALEQVISKHEALIKSLRKFRDDLRLDDNLSPLDPFQRLQEAQKQFQETATAALGGDEEAMGRLEDVSRAYLEEARSYYATSEAYFSIFNEVESILDQALGVADKHLSEAQQQLDALKAQVSALIDINDSVMSVADAVAALALAEEANAAAIAGRDAQQAGLYQQVLALLQANGQAFDPAITGLYQDVLGRAPDKAGADFWTNALHSGISLAEIEALMRQSAEFANLKGFDTGGFTGFGNPSQIAGLVHAGEFVVKAAATAPNLSALNYLNQTGRLPSNDNGSLLQAVQNLSEQVASLEESNQRITADAATAQIDATDRNTQAVNKQAEVMRQMQYQRRAG